MLKTLIRAMDQKNKSDVQMTQKKETTKKPSDWTVAGERDRCIEIVRYYLSPRNGIRLARQPHGILEEIIDKIRTGVQP